MYSGFNFFMALISIAFVLNFVFARFLNQTAKVYLLAILSFATGFLIFNSYYVLVLFLIFYVLTWLRFKGFFNNLSTAVLLVLAPLVMIKFGSTKLSFLAVVGLSFMTFRAVDAILQVHKQEKFNFVEYFAYIFMPFIALTGPMYRWKTFKTDISENLLISKKIDFSGAFYLIALGVIQKFLIADFIYFHLLAHIDAKDFSLYGIALNASVYSLFLYFDFAGYSNMAIGSGKLFGFNFPQNFNNPILSKNPQDFWRRWHMSLSFWLRDMVFMPIYAHLVKFKFFLKHRLFAQNIGIFSTLFVMGVWNGLQIKYIASGVLFGIYSMSHNSLVHFSNKKAGLKSFLANPFVSFLGRVLTIVLAMFALYVFSGRSFIG